MYSDREPVLCKYTGAAHVVVHVQCLRAPVYPGCEMNICGLVRHGCVEWGLVTTQDRHKYNTCHSLFCPGKYKPRLRFGLYGLYFPYQTKIGIYYIHISTQYIAHWFTSLSTLARYDEPGLNLALRIFILHCYQVRPHSSVLRWWVHKGRNSTVRRLSISTQYIFPHTPRLQVILYTYCYQEQGDMRKN